MDTNDYFNKRNYLTLNKLEKTLKHLPQFVNTFILGIENNTSPLTRLNYATDLKIFFYYISNKYDVKIDKIDLNLLNKITSTDIEQFLSYLSSFVYENKLHSCNEKAKARKLASVRSLFKYFFNKNFINSNVSAKVLTPKIHDKEILRLEQNEVVDLLNIAETGCGLSQHCLAYQKNTSLRDLTLLTLFLGTGIRISELVGLNVDDIFFDNNSFVVTRKGGNRTILYFTDEVKNQLQKWIEFRSNIKNLNKNEKALFISLRNTRLSIRAVEELVKKYAKIISPLKHITPHKLRSTFGTNLYRETGDIYVVADYLGHRDINTTKKHYAAISDDIRKKAIKTIKLRDDE